MYEKHGMYQTRRYTIWTDMKQRCYNPKSIVYKNYGGRGIRICDAWKDSFIQFYNDTKKGYTDSLTIERINNDGNYCPENCRWATRQEQLLNSRHIKHITIGTVTRTLSEWLEIYGISRGTYSQRVCSYKWTPVEALTKPVRRVFITIGNETKPLTEWLKIYNIRRDTHKSRIYRGMNPIEALIKPIGKQGRPKHFI